jgi:hypothetical protein
MRKERGMTRTPIAQVAKAIGQELRRASGPSGGAWAAGAMLAEAGATRDIATHLLAEARRKRPSDRVIEGCAFLLERALDSLRLRQNGGDIGAGHEIDEVRGMIEGAVAEGGIAPEVLMTITRAFAQAELEPGGALQEAVVDALEAQATTPPASAAPGDLGEQLHDVAAALGNDPFAIYTELAATGAAFPPDHRAAMAAALALSSNAAVREAALGFVCSPEPEVGGAVLEALAQPPRGRPVSSTMVERLVRLRPWLAEARRAPLDAAVRVLRPKAAAPEAPPRPEIRSVMATLCDGAGAQSFYVPVRRGRRFVLAALLTKHGIGVADAWAAADLSKAEADAMVAEVEAGSETVDVSVGLLERRLADALAANVSRDVPPPFGLLQVAEVLGLGPLHPAAITPTALATELHEGLPEAQTGTVAAAAAHRASARWHEAFATLESWFEAGEAVEALLRPLRTRKQRIVAVLTQLLPVRRGFWAERCAWMAATLKEGDEDDEAWVEFALVARDLAGERPLDAMPLAAQIAAATVEAFQHR